MASLVRWEAKAQQWYKEDIAQDRINDEELRKAFQSMNDATRKDILAYYAEYARSEGVSMAEAKRRVSQIDIEATERRVYQLSNAGLSERAMQEARLLELTMNINRLQNIQANIGFNNIEGYDKLDTFFNDKLTERSATQLRRNAGMLDLQSDDIKEAATAIANSTFKNATYSERLWANQSELQSDIAIQISNGLIQGKSADQMAYDIQGKYGGKLSDAQRLMRTELRRAQTEADRVAYEARGIKEYIYRTEPGCCEKCKSLNNRKYLVAGMEIGVNAPPMHPNCRCYTIPIEEQEKKPLCVRFMNFINRIFGRETVENAGSKFTNGGKNGIINQAITSGDVFKGMTPDEIRQRLIDEGHEVMPLGSRSSHFQDVPYEQGGGYRVLFGGNGVFIYHPEKYSHHGGAYYKISSGELGVYRHYRTDGTEFKTKDTKST